jgi:predicted outer membrane lipoprotein
MKHICYFLIIFLLYHKKSYMTTHLIKIKLTLRVTLNTMRRHWLPEYWIFAKWVKNLELFYTKSGAIWMDGITRFPANLDWRPTELFKWMTATRCSILTAFWMEHRDTRERKAVAVSSGRRTRKKNGTVLIYLRVRCTNLKYKIIHSVWHMP